MPDKPAHVLPNVTTFKQANGDNLTDLFLYGIISFCNELLSYQK